MKVKCPGCGKPTEFTPDNKFRPFCSERCSTGDLGAWADESYKVPVSVQETESVNRESGAQSSPEADFSDPDKLH